MTRTLLAVLLAGPFLVSVQPPAAASPAGEALHKQALVAARDGFYVKAKALWNKAYRLDREPKYLYNLGLIAEESDKPLEALEYHERFLKEAPDRPEYAVLRGKAKLKVKALLQRVAALELVVRQPGVVVFVDQRAVGKGPIQLTVRLTQGEHLVVATLDGYHGQTHRLQLFGGQKRTLNLVLSKIIPKIVKQKARMRYPMPRWLPWTLLGTGLAIAASSIAPLVVQMKAYKDYNDSIDPPLLPEGVLSLKRKADRIWASGIALVAIGGAMAVAGVIAILLNRPKLEHQKPDDKPSKVETIVGPGSLALRLHF